MGTTRTVIVQNWEESERSWGVRPDGFTVHISKEQRDAYVSWYNQTFNNLSEAPDEYTRVSGAPIEVEVDDKLFERIRRASQRKRKDGKPLNSVHGKEKFFSTSPMRSLKDADIEWSAPGE